MNEEPKVVFMGTGEIAIPSFRWLLESGPKPVALITQPDRPAGRKRELKAPPIKQVAVEFGVPVIQPEKIRDSEVLDQIAAIGPDLIVVMAYGQILPRRLIEMAPLGCVNLHASLLPKYRGAACIQAAIDAGDARTGVTLMHVVKELDAGDVILAKETEILPSDTGGSVHDRLADVAREALVAGLPGLLDGSQSRTPQSELGEVSHVPKLDRDDGRLDWAWTAERIERRLRAYDPWPGCWTSWQDGTQEKRLKIFPVAGILSQGPAPGIIEVREGRALVGCAEGALELDQVQADGSRRMAAIDWLRGRRQGNTLGLH